MEAVLVKIGYFIHSSKKKNLNVCLFFAHVIVQCMCMSVSGMGGSSALLFSGTLATGLSSSPCSFQHHFRGQYPAIWCIEDRVWRLFCIRSGSGTYHFLSSSTDCSHMTGIYLTGSEAGNVALWTELCPPPHSYVEVLTPKDLRMWLFLERGS